MSKPLQGIGAVSYTHLDVYKRQINDELLWTKSFANSQDLLAGLADEALKYSVVATLICLFLFGYFKSKITGVSAWQGALKVMSIGALAAGAAFGVAKLFEGM